MAGGGSNAAMNPYGSSRMKDTLGSRQGAGAGAGVAGFGGKQQAFNLTASQTVLAHTSRGTRKSFVIPDTNQAKRQKTGHAVTSKHFPNGGHAGKGKEPVRNGRRSASEAQTIGTDEDTGEPVARRDSDVEIVESGGPSTRTDPSTTKGDSPDPIDCIDVGPSSDMHVPRHDFDEPSSHGPNRGRLAQDGPSTRRLQAKQKQRAPSEHEVIEVDDSDDIQSASGFEDDAAAPVRAMTPKGKSPLPPIGNVKSKTQLYEQRQLTMVKDNGGIRHIDLLNVKPKPQSRVSAMRNKPPLKTQPAQTLGQFNKLPVVGNGATEQLDAAATSTSGFSKSQDLPAPLPLQGWSLGCRLKHSVDPREPNSWLVLCQNPQDKSYQLKVTRKAEDKTPVQVFRLDRDFDSMTYSDPSEDLRSHDACAVMQLRSTQSLKPALTTSGFSAGDRHCKGLVSFRFMVQHPNWTNEPHYTRLVELLRGQIKGKHSVLKSRNSAGAWEGVRNAAEMFKAGDEPLPTRSTPLRRDSPMPTISVGPSSLSSSAGQAVEPSERSSVPAPPSRTYGAAGERRYTRQSTRSTRTSPSPDLDELLLVYPFSGTGAVNITRGDLKRLDAGQYLNDTVIEFGLKVWLEDLRRERPELAEKVHVFNSFFYKKLNPKRGTSVADSYQSVRKWTSKVDIFKKKYIIVPINENFHWYLAIIENPENMLHPPPPEATIAPQTRKRKRDSAVTDGGLDEDEDAPSSEDKDAVKTSKRVSEDPVEPITDSITLENTESDGDGQEVDAMLHFSQSCSISDIKEISPERKGTPDQAELISIENAELLYPPSDDPMDVDAKPERSVTRERSALPPAVLDSLDDIANHQSESVGRDQHASPQAGDTPVYPQCHIYTFDSLGGRHPSVGKNLAHYLRHEAVDKKKVPIEDTCMANLKQAKSPLQNNFCDCGLFVLAFVEQFMRDPVASSALIREGKATWYTATSTDLREAFRLRSLRIAEEWKKHKAAKEETKEAALDNKEIEKETAATAEMETATANPEPEVIDDSDIEVSEVYQPPSITKASNRGGKKATKANRLR